jgi:hypothetical protein
MLKSIESKILIVRFLSCLTAETVSSTTNFMAKSERLFFMKAAATINMM